VAAIEKGPVLACQFHPELSGPWGLELIKRWLFNTHVAEPAKDLAVDIQTLSKTRRIIPCLDVADGKVVKGKNDEINFGNDFRNQVSKHHRSRSPI
jgi:glutamine amidotransferase/cyclase